MHGVVELKHSGRSLIYNKNINGPKSEPSGTPQVIVFFDDICSLILHCCSLLDKYDSNHFSSMYDLFFAARHVMQHRRQVQRVGVVTHDPPTGFRAFETVRVDHCLAGYVVAFEHQAFPPIIASPNIS